MGLLEYPLRHAFVLSIVLLALEVSCTTESSSTCIQGCKCSPVNEAAVCCLFNYENKSRQEQHESFSQDFCALPTNPDSPKWPHSFRCLPSWRQLKIHLFDYSWSSLQTLHTNSTYSCNQNLERLILIGSPGIQDDLHKLEPSVFRNFFFPLPNSVALRRFTIEQTSLNEISPGFFDQIRTNQLTDLEIRRNPSLTSDHLGVGWLANTHELKLLDLSQNKLYSVNLARWGFSKSKTSSLTTLDLSGNRISQLKADTFQRVPNIIQLYLADNLLSNLPLTIFSNLHHLRLLDLQGNRLKLIGLHPASLSLALTLPNLRHLKLSRNPLIDSSTNITAHWWLTSSCPSHLTTLYMENIDVSQSISSTAPQLQLPPIAWNYCSSLVELRLTQIHPSSCLSQSWLGVGWDTVSTPTKFRIYPPTLHLCTPPSRSLRIEKDLSIDAVPGSRLSHLQLTNTPETRKHSHLNSNYRSLHSKLQPTPVAINSAYWPTVTDHSARVVHLRSTSFLSSWLVLSLIVLLLLAIFVMIAFSVFYCIRHHQQQNRHSKKPYPTYATSPMTSSSNFDYLNPVSSRKADFLHSQSNIHSHLSSIEPIRLSYPQYLSFTPGQIPHLTNHYYDSQPQHRHLSHQFIATQPVSPVDSGLEDLTPLTYPQSISRLSPSSTQTSVRLTRKSRQARRSGNPNSAHFPSTSFTSLVSGRLILPANPNEPMENAPLWFSSLGLEPRSMTGDMTNSVENISLDPSTNQTTTTMNQSSSAEATDAGSVPSQSDKATLIVMSENR